MTQELIFWVLLLGSVGLVWVFTCAMLTRDRSRNRPLDESALNDQQDANTEASPRKAAA
jgi:hypothetical protein